MEKMKKKICCISQLISWIGSRYLTSTGQLDWMGGFKKRQGSDKLKRGKGFEFEDYDAGAKGFNEGVFGQGFGQGFGGFSTMKKNSD